MLPRPLGATVLVLALFTGCNLFGSKAASSPERFVGSDAAAVLVVPTLEGLAKQGSELLGTAATFPGGQTLLDGRAVLHARLGFDPFDASSLAGAGLDAKRGAAVGVRLAGEGSQAAASAEAGALALAARSGSEPAITLSLPVADAARFDGTLTRLARERLGLQARTPEAGKPEVIAYRRAEADGVQVAYALAEKTAVLGFGPNAIEDVRAALAVPRDGHIGTTPAFKTAVAAAGTGLAWIAFLPPGSPLTRESPQTKDGLALGLRAAADRLELVGCTLLGAREDAVRKGIRSGAAPLLAKLEPGASIVMRGEGEPASMMPREELAALLGKRGIPEAAGQAVLDAYDSLGSGAALGFGLVPVADGAAPQLREAPLAFFRAELLVALKDADRMKALLGRLPDEVRRQVQPSGDGLSTVMAPGGEVGWTVQKDRLLVAVGPKGALQALVARSGSSFRAPTPTSAKALDAPVGGMYVDVPRLAKAVQAIPAACYGEGASAGAVRSTAQQWATTAARITAVSARAELVPGVQRSTIVIEVAPPAR